MAKSFNTMSSELKRAETSEQQFLQSVSHELKTPLTAIEGYVELLADGAVPADEAAKVLTAESGRLQRLVADLIDLGKMGQSSFSVVKEPVDLGRVAAAVAQRYRPQAREFGVELAVALPDGTDRDAPPVVLGDEDRLVQAVSNLVENALRSTPQGGSVSIKLEADGSLCVSDTGPGLTSEEREHAFERFYLYEHCKEKRTVGTGLGLAIVKQLVDAMGGEVTVESEEAAGTAFCVRLPLAPEAGEPES